MRYLWFLLCLFLLVPVVKAEEVCIDKDTYSRVYDKLLKLNSIEQSLPTFRFSDSIIIFVDKNNRVFSNATGEKQLSGTLELGSMKYDLNLGVTLEVQKKKEPDYGFRLRPKFTASWLVLNTSQISDSPLSLVDLGVDLDVMYFKQLNANAYVGIRSVGVDLGWDIFNNSGVALGIRWEWPSHFGEELEFNPSIGWYFVF